MLYADVAVRVPARPGTRRGEPLADVETGVFSYGVPEALQAALRVGHWVWVPFGARHLAGLVLRIDDTEPGLTVRPIEAILDDRPAITAAQLAVATWMSNHYLSPLFDCVALFLPPGLTPRTETVYGPGELPRGATPLEEAAQRLTMESGSLTGAALAQGLRGAAPQEMGRGWLLQLLKRGVVTRIYRLAQPAASASTRPRAQLLEPLPEAKRLAATALVSSAPTRVLVALAQLADEGLIATEESVAERAGVTLAEARKQLRQVADGSSDPWDRALDALRPANMRAALEQLEVAGGSAWANDLTTAAGCTSLALERLVQAGTISLSPERFYRDPFLGNARPAQPLPELTPDQNAAYRAVAAALEGGPEPAYLLHGVTGSGKTEVYLHAVAKALSQGRRSIVLVPEIALTPQTLQRFSRHFPGRVAVQHSRLTPSQRYDQWTRVQNGEADVVIGPRSTLFMPVSNLGLVVLDEEHDASYKEPSRPNYHARSVAYRLAQEVGAALVLGSATPDVGTYRAAERRALGLLRLPERYGGAQPLPLPQVEVVDMRAELREGHTSLLSRPLTAALAAALARGEQAILYLNRRGTATFVMCRDCGHVQECPRCELPFTLHLVAGRAVASPRLICHHCGDREPVPSTCPECHSTRIRYFGAGTERVEVQVRQAFPGARLLRWDADSSRGPGGHQALLDEFAHHRADILVGTQMIAKGLDLPLVTVVGVISADVSLYFPDFRSGERTFQLLSQVVGRAGRRAGGGRAYIQTYHPDHYAIQAAAAHDYAGFYSEEIALRRQLGYPPFGDMVRLLFAAARHSRARAAADELAARLRDRIRRDGLPNLEVIGPAPAYYARLAGQYRFNLLLRGDRPQDLLLAEPPPPGWRIDMDPLDFL